MIIPERVHSGMLVRTSAGSRYGRVLEKGPETFVLRHGHVIHEDFEVPYADVEERDGSLWLRLHGGYADERRAADGLSSVSAGSANRHPSI